MPYLRLVDCNTLTPQIFLSFLNLDHKRIVCFWDIVEGKDTKTELEQEKCAETDDRPERQLEMALTIPMRFIW